MKRIKTFGGKIVLLTGLVLVPPPTNASSAGG
jgi:hypothetical protein